MDVHVVFWDVVTEEFLMGHGKLEGPVSRKYAGYYQTEHQLQYYVSLLCVRQRTKNYGMKQRIPEVLLSASSSHVTISAEQRIHYMYYSYIINAKVYYFSCPLIPINSN